MKQSITATVVVMLCLTIGGFLCVVESGPITWQNGYASVGKNAGWGRMISTTAPLMENSTLLTWTEYDVPLPACSSNWLHNGPEVW